MHQTATAKVGMFLNQILLGTAAIALAWLFPPIHALADTKVTVSEPWVREAPPNMRMHAGYATLHNRTTAPVHLVFVASPTYEKVELHLSKVENGIGTMVKQDQITIPANGTLKMAPGGFHLMLMHPKRALTAGDKVEVTFGFADGSRVSFQAPVKKIGGMSNTHHHMPHRGH